MKRIISAGQAVFALAILLGLQGCGSNRGTDWQPSATPTFEDVLRTATYVGAEVCAGCHVDNHSGWAATAHQQILRDGAVETSYVNDGDASGRADFFDGAVMDLATAAAGSCLRTSRPLPTGRTCPPASSSPSLFRKCSATSSGTPTRL